MSKKAEAAAMKAYPVKMEMQYDQETRLPLWEDDVNVVERTCYREGYDQAEKDLALCWEDMRTIFYIVIRVSEKHLFDGTSDQDVYREALREFNESRRQRNESQD